MLRQHIRDIKICGKVYTIKSIKPIDFSGDDDGCPVCFFVVKKTETMYERAMRESGAEESIDRQDEIRAIKKLLGVSVISVDSEPFDVDKFMKEETDIYVLIELYSYIISNSFSVVAPIEFSKKQIENIDTIARRYGVQPIDVLMPSGGYTDMDAYTFNLVVADRGISEKINHVNRSKIQVVATID